MELGARRFASLLLPTIGLCIVAYAMLLSFTVVDGNSTPDPTKNYYLRLDTAEAKLRKEFLATGCADREKMRDFGLLLWQNNKIEEAAIYLRLKWEEHQSQNTTTYDADFVQDGLNLAGIYVDRGSNGLAEAIYNRIIEYDTAHLAPTDPRLGRDYNNMALCYLQSAQATPTWDARKAWLVKSIDASKKAESIFRASPKSQPQLVASLQNQVVANSELGEEGEAFKLSDIVDKQLNDWHNHKINTLTASK